MGSTELERLARLEEQFSHLNKTVDALVESLENISKRFTYLLLLLSAANVGGQKIWDLIAKVLT